MITKMRFDQNHFSNFIIRNLESTGMTQRELAKRTGIHYNTIGGYVKGVIMPSAENYYRIVECFGYKIILTKDDYKRNPN